MKHDYVPIPEGDDTPTDSQEATSNQPAAIGGKVLDTLGIEHPHEQIVPDSLIAEKFERDGFIKEAPFLSDQLQDESRTNPITYIEGLKKSPGWATFSETYSLGRTVISEIDALNSFDAFLRLVEQELTGSPYAEEARSIRDNLTFIGEKEYKEAAAGIASSWRAKLEADQEQQILVVTGEIARDQVKSDEYLLENILSTFSEEEFEAYKGRLLVDSGHLLTVDPTNMEIILLDDWVISGMQMTDVYKKVITRRPDLKDAVKIQLIAAEELMIEDGFRYRHTNGSETSVPVQAYFKAHPAEDYLFDAYITGSESSTDNLENPLGRMVRELDRVGVSNKGLPPPAGIVRKYGGYKDIAHKKLPYKAKWSS